MATYEAAVHEVNACVARAFGLDPGSGLAHGTTTPDALRSAAGQLESAPDRSSSLEVGLRNAVTRYFLLPATARPLPLHPFLQILLSLLLSVTAPGAGGEGALADPAIAFSLLEDVFEAIPIPHIEGAWGVVEAHRQALHPFVQAGRGGSTPRARTALLRLTSGLLRRLSRTQDTVMCGKVLLFLANILPLSERSGVNVPGFINVDNSTAYEGEAEDVALTAVAAAHKPPVAATAAAVAAGRAAPLRGAPAPPAAAKGTSAPPQPIPSPTAAGKGEVVSNGAAAKSDSLVAALPPAPAVTLDGRYALQACYDAVKGAYEAADKGVASSSPAFYRAFWRLQYLCYRPSLMCASAESWALMTGTLRSVLRGFEKEDEEAGLAKAVQEGKGPAVGAGKVSLPPAVPTLALVTISSVDAGAASVESSVTAAALVLAPPTAAGSPGTGAPSSTEGGAGDKYLTAPSLLALELRDGGLRRHVLMQALAALQHFTLPRKGDKDKPPHSGCAGEIATLRAACLSLLRRTSPGGIAFASAVSLLIGREVHWASWKAAGAAAIERPLGKAPPAATDEGIGGAKRRPQTAQPAARKLRALDWASVGADVDLLAVVKDPSRAVRPTLRAFVIPLKAASEPDSGIEAEFAPQGDETYVWRGMRLLARENLPALAGASGEAPFVAAVCAATGMRIRMPQPAPSPPPAPSPLPPFEEAVECGESEAAPEATSGEMQPEEAAEELREDSPEAAGEGEGAAQEGGMAVEGEAAEADARFFVAMEEEEEAEHEQ
jgi:hypothetical protein